MNITQLLHAKDSAGTGLAVNTTRDIATPQDRDGRKFYRQLYFLAFKLEPGCHGIVIDDDASQWQGWFNSFDLSLTAGDKVFQTKDWTAEKEDGSATPTLVKVHLVHPWRVVAVNTNDVRGVAVLRLDGDAVSDKATLSGNANSTLPGEFIGQDFALRKVAPFLSIKNPQQEIQKAGGAKKIMMAKSAGSGTTATQIDNIQAQAQANAIVASHGIKNIHLRSLPTGPRILLGEIDATPDANTALTSLWQQPGEQTALPVTFFADEQSRKSALQQLQQKFDRYFAEREKSDPPPPPLPTYLYLPIAFESDTPARLRLTALNLQYHLLRNRFDALDTKHTLKFAGGTVTAQSLTLGLPANSQITRAQFQVTNNLKPGFALNGIAGSASLNGHTGIDLTEGSTVSNRVDNATPLQLQHLLLALLPLTDSVQATLHVLRDNQDSPAGAVLAQTQLQLNQTGVRQWAVASIAPLLLDSGPCWLRLTVQQGRLFWLGQNAPGHVQFTTGAGPGKAVRTLQLMAMLSAAGANENGMAGLSVQVNNVGASSSGNAEEGIQIDLAAGLNGHFGSGTAAPAPVAFVSGSAGNITVSNLQVEYNI